MHGALGPDAHVRWPASGEDLRAAVARAVAAAATVRPRVPGRQLAGMIVFAVGAVLLVLNMVRKFSGAGMALDLLPVVGGGLLGAGSLLGAPFSAVRQWDLIVGASMLFLSAVLLVLRFVL